MKIRIEGKRITLRSLRKSDEFWVAKHANDKEVARYITLPHPYSLRDAKKFIKKSKNELRKSKPKEICCGIELKENKKVIGVMSFVIDWKNENAEVGYWLGREYWGRGLAREALLLLLEYGFKKLKLKKIYARVHEPNVRSAKLLERVGFKIEGKLREHAKYRFGNKRLDVFLYGILPGEIKN